MEHIHDFYIDGCQVTGSHAQGLTSAQQANAVTIVRDLLDAAQYGEQLDPVTFDLRGRDSSPDGVMMAVQDAAVVLSSMLVKLEEIANG